MMAIIDYQNLSKIMFEIWQAFYVHVVRNLVYI